MTMINETSALVFEDAVVLLEQMLTIILPKIFRSDLET